MISCEQCGDEYIGETARPLCVRIKEQLEGKKKSCDSTALGGHRVRCHNGEDFEVKITISEREPGIAARKTGPKMNRKEESLCITREHYERTRALFETNIGNLRQSPNNSYLAVARVS
ncbi:hypothetical protein RB195_011507 [Necator americanus]|uniref:Uncharacterized protein n=1 Tax=Necator americanus TaxID=51031 RepID=A0ABR1D2Q1_NECAM